MTKKKPRPEFPPRARVQFPLEGRAISEGIDHILSLKLGRASPDDILSASIILRFDEARAAYPDWVARSANALIAKVTDIVGEPPDWTYILATMDTLVVRAKVKFLQVLINQPAVFRAIDNNPNIPLPGDPTIQ